MTDMAIENIPVQELDLAAALGSLGPKPAAVNRMQLAKINLMQSTSALVKDPASGVKAGQFLITFDKEGITPPILTEFLRVIVLDVFNGQIMYPFDETGNKKQGADVKAACGSNNGEAPRPDYLGQTFTDYRRNHDGSYAEWTIIDSCKDCPLGEWLPQYEFDRKTGMVKMDEKTGKPMIKRGADGKPMNAKPPCAKTVSYIVYLPDYGIPAKFQVSGSVAAMLSKRKLVDYFAIAANGGRPNVVDNKAKCVRLQPKLEAYRDNSPSWTLDVFWDGAFLDMPQTLRWLELAKMYEDMGIRNMLTSTGFIGEQADPEEAAPPVDETEKSGVDMDMATGKSKLGTPAKSKRRISAEDTEDLFSDSE